MMGYMEHEEAWKNFENDFPKESYSLQNKEIKKLLKDLACRLAYENLYEDGELTESEAFRKEKALTMKLRKIERKVGRKLEEKLEVFQ